MFSKCANPGCLVPFEYHLGGRFYRFHQDKLSSKPQRNTHAVIHFWLCPRCADVYALDYDGTHCLLTHSVGYQVQLHRSQSDAAENDVSQHEDERRLVGAGPEKGAGR